MIDDLLPGKFLFDLIQNRYVVKIDNRLKDKVIQENHTARMSKETYDSLLADYEVYKKHLIEESKHV